MDDERQPALAGRDGNGRLWTAPRGAVLDGWSVPRELRALPGLPLESEYRKAAVLHLPERVEFVAELPHTKAGKLDKAALRAEIARRLGA